MDQAFKIFYISIIGYKKGPRNYGPYSNSEFDPEKTLSEFRSKLEQSFRADLKWK